MFILLGLIGWVVFTFVTHTLPVSMLTLARATETATATIPVPATLASTSNFTATPAAEIPHMPEPTSAQPQSGAIFKADFSSPFFNDTFDSSQWSLYGVAYTTIKQVNGVMLFTKSSTNGPENGKLKTVLSWSPEEFSYIEARVKVNQQHKGNMGNINIWLEKDGWYVGCGLSVGATQPSFFCNQAEAPYTSTDYYQASSTPAACDRWYTVRIEIDPQTFGLTFYKDGQYFGYWRPANANQLLEDTFNVVIGIWADKGTSLTGSVDDVKVVK